MGRYHYLGHEARLVAKIKGFGEILHLEGNSDTVYHELKKAEAHVPSANEAAYLETRPRSKLHPSLIREGILYTPDETIIVRESPIFKDVQVAENGPIHETGVLEFRQRHKYYPPLGVPVWNILGKTDYSRYFDTAKTSGSQEAFLLKTGISVTQYQLIILVQMNLQDGYSAILHRYMVTFWNQEE